MTKKNNDEKCLIDGTLIEIAWLERLISKEVGSTVVISKAEPLALDAIGFMSVMRRVFLQNEDGTPYTPESVIVKSPSSAGAIKAIAAASGMQMDSTPPVNMQLYAHRIECRALTLLTKHKASHNIKLPKIYATKDTSCDFPCIVMEDLHDSHVVDLIEGFDEKKLYQLMDQIIEIHAFSFRTDEWREPEREEGVKLTEMCGPLLQGMFTKFFSTYSDTFGDVGWKLMENTINKEGYLLASQRRYTKGERKSVLCHGDMWSSNFLWKGDKLSAVIDWQRFHAGSPIEDILRILSTCTSSDNRKTLTKPLLDYYYTRMQEKMDKMPFTREELDEEMLFFKPYGCVWTVFANAFWVPQVLRTEDRIKESFDRCLSYLQETAAEQGW